MMVCASQKHARDIVTGAESWIKKVLKILHEEDKQVVILEKKAYCGELK